MPSGSGTNVGVRIATVVAVALAILIVGFLLLRGGGDSYEVTLALPNADQLVKGNQVKVGGVEVGKIKSIKLADNGEALIKFSVDPDDLTPLHVGTVARIRSTVAVRDREPLHRAHARPVERAEDRRRRHALVERHYAEVDLDEVLNTLDPQTQKDLQDGITSSAEDLQGRRRQEPERGADQSSTRRCRRRGQTESEIIRDQATFQNFLIESADVVSAVASRDPEIPSLDLRRPRHARRGRPPHRPTSSPRSTSFRRRCARRTRRSSTRAARSPTCARPCASPSRSRSR